MYEVDYRWSTAYFLFAELLNDHKRIKIQNLLSQ